MLTTILLLMSGILVGVATKYLTRFVRLPYTVLLFAIGIALGLLSKASWMADNPYFENGIRLISMMDPDFILYVFLPILVFDAAYEMDLHIFQKTLFNASMLAGPGVVICMLLTAGLVMGLETLVAGYDPTLWPYALMFGGLISATDPVAVVALLQELGTSKRFSTLVDGESLLNDGTGLVCFMMFYSRFAGEGNIDNPLLYFVWVVLASTAIGLVFARLTIWLVEHVVTEEVLQNCILVAAAYITFMLAQKAFDVSGVIALVAFGQCFSQSGRPHLKPETNEWMEKFWSFLAYICNTLIFLIVGVVIATRVDLTWTMVLGIIPVFVGLNLIRYIMILVLMPILRHSGYGLSWREFVILGWGGLRGALGMSMALMVSCNTAIPESIRHHILVYTAGVVTLTLLINATTSKSLVARLKLIEEQTPTERHFWHRFLMLIRRGDQEQLAALRSNPYLAQADWKTVESKMLAVPDIQDESLPVLGKEMLAIIRTYLTAHAEAVSTDYFHRGILNFYSYNRIAKAIAVLNDAEGKQPFDAEALCASVRRFRFLVGRRRRFTDACNLCRGYVMLLLEEQRFLQTVQSSPVIDLPIEQECITTIAAELEALLAAASALLDDYRREDPVLFAEAVTDKAVRMLLASERSLVEQLVADGLIPGDTADVLLSDISRRQGYEIVG